MSIRIHANTLTVSQIWSFTCLSSTVINLVPNSTLEKEKRILVYICTYRGNYFFFGLFLLAFIQYLLFKAYPIVNSRPE